MIDRFLPGSTLRKEIDALLDFIKVEETMERHCDTILIAEIFRLRAELKRAARKESSEDVDYVVLVNQLKDENACLALDKSEEIKRRVKLERERDALTQQVEADVVILNHLKAENDSLAFDKSTLQHSEEVLKRERDILLKQVEMGKRVEAELRKSLDMTEKALQDANAARWGNANGYSKSDKRKINPPDEFAAMWRDYIQKMENDLDNTVKAAVEVERSECEAIARKYMTAQMVADAIAARRKS